MEVVNDSSNSTDRQEFYDRVAPIYDKLNDLLSLRRHRAWKSRTVSESGAKEGDTVLDLCCGSGDMTFLLSEKVVPEGKVVGLDLSKELLAVASARQQSSSKECHKNIKWMQGDALDLPFDESYFDAVTIGYGLRSMEDRRKALKEIYRVLKPGSKVSVLDYNKNTNRFKALFQEWMIDKVAIPVSKMYGVAGAWDGVKESVRGYLTGKELEDLALEAGFSKAKHYELDFGYMGNLVATK